MAVVTLESLTEESVELYSLPDIYFQINEIINDPRLGARDMGRIIQLDPSLSVRLLKIVNSSYYGFKSRIDTIERAITIVGLDDLLNLILATSVIDSFSDIPNDLADMTSFWFRSVNCALIARVLARKNAVLHCERLFLSGLLHDIGSLILYQKLPELSKQVLLASNRNRSLTGALEKQIIGFTHADVGSALFEKWGLPASLSASVKYYLKPELAQTYLLDTWLLSVAARLCDGDEKSGLPHGIVSDLYIGSCNLKAMNAAEIDEVLSQAEYEFADVFDLLTSKKKFQ